MENRVVQKKFFFADRFFVYQVEKEGKNLNKRDPFLKLKIEN